MAHHDIGGPHPQELARMRTNKRKAARAALRKSAITLNGTGYQIQEQLQALKETVRRLTRETEAVQSAIDTLMMHDNERGDAGRAGDND